MSDKYLRCETLTGEWWYKDMETGEDLPMYATPIERKSWQDLNNECSELNRICKQLKNQLEVKDKEIERLKKREQECIDHYLVQCKYASEMEDKYITANNIINEFDKFLFGELQTYGGGGLVQEYYNKLQELKGSEYVMDNRTIEQIRDNETRLIKELQQKENIIKEVREYCDKEIGNIIAYFDYIDTKDLENIKKILDKGSDKE